MKLMIRFKRFIMKGFLSSEVMGDFNGDGKPDLAVSNELRNDVSIFLNTTQ